MTMSDDTSDGGSRYEEPSVGLHIRNDDVLLSFRTSRLHVSVDEDEDEPTPSGRCSSWRFTLPEWYVTELKQVLKLALPIMLVCLMQFASSPIAIMFCGRLGTNIFAGVSLAISLINIAVVSVSQGLSSACDTLFTQSYGSSNKKMMGVYLQRSLVLLTLASIVVIAIILNGEKIFLAIGENPSISRVAGEYLLLYVPGAVANFIFQVLARYIMSQNRVIALIVVAGLSDVVSAVTHYLLIYQANYGYHGSALAMSLTHISLAIFTISYIVASRMYEPTWSGWTGAAFYDWGSFMKLAIPGLLMVSLDYLVFEAGVLSSALLGDIYVSALNVILQLATCLFQCYLGLGIGACVRVGQHLGSGDGISARRSCIVGYSVMIPVAVFSSCLFVAIPEYLAMIFTNEPEIIALVAGTLPFGPAIYQIFNGLNQISNGILRGTGRQTLGMLSVLIPYLCIGVPIAIPAMMLTSMNINGFFTGMTIGMVIECAFVLVVIYRTQWDREIEKAAMNTKTDADEKVTEKTRLLADSSNEDAEYGSVEVKDETKTMQVSSGLILKRLVAVFVVLAILAAGILIRFYVNVGDELPPNDCLDSQWGGCQTTTAFPTPKNVTKERLFGVFR